MVLTVKQLGDFETQGFVFPLAGLTPAHARALRAACIEHLRGTSGVERYELTDDIRVRAREGAEHEFEYFDEAPEPDLRELPFLFNLWKVDRRFWEAANEPRLVAYARELLHTDEVLLFEDNVVVKMPGARYVPWHQDYSYWPLGSPTALTVWIALDAIGSQNGAMEVAPGTQREGERLPVKFLDGTPFMGAERPGIPAVPQEPSELGHAIVTYALRPGECGIHDALVWHGSTENRSDQMRFALVLRYVAAGTIWLGSSRIPYDDVGCAVGQGLSGAHFPAVGVGGEFVYRG